ncbi:flagellar export protein FliJ [Thiomicrorhabdus sp. ZW0627]|uniref:flagellar export protein FliJ n=1 Tax=Thiomicrorhabdus sp. ZW0627 TaxID=3039774 RepID=UPI002436FD27|nr:flagellar export protein FliJ [Thiomicrorhabdus sp. ZW0627]MDG6773342.1 flagellar export protein FliJ [Thiomicrorhabdus sp. ZW0627]
MTSRIQKIQTLVDLAEIEEERSAKTFAEIQAQHKHHLQQLEMLKTYVEEYSQANVSKGQTFQPIQMLSTQAFVAKLQHAVQAESDKVDEFSKMVERAREAWLEKRTRMNALKKLHGKLVQDHQFKLDKQEQRFLDELSSQNFNKKQ